MGIKQVILVRQDLKMDKGKLAVQVAHASVEATLKTSSSLIKQWRLEGMKKIVLKVKDLKELHKFKMHADDYGLTTALITDAGKTFFKRPTITCLAIGPDEEEKIDRITGELTML